MPQVSLIILAERGSLPACRWLDALHGEGSAGIDTEAILVAESESEKEAAEIHKAYHDAVQLVRWPKGKGFGAACNEGRAVSSADLLVFARPFMAGRPGWLRALLHYAKMHPAAGIIGSKILSLQDVVLHAGVVICHDHRARPLYVGLPADHKAVSRSRRLQAINVEGALVQRIAFDKAKGFDPAFSDGYADVDLCLRLGRHGYQVHYCHESVLYVAGPAPGRWQLEGRDNPLFRRRWSRRVRADDLQCAMEDGLLTVDYRNGYPLHISVSPELATIDEESPGVQRDLAAARGTLEVLGVARKTLELALTLLGEKQNGAPRRDDRSGTGKKDAGGLAAEEVGKKIPSHTQPAAGKGRAEEAPSGPQAVQAKQPGPATAGGAKVKMDVHAYAGMIRRVRQVARAVLPRESPVIVISKGDEELLKLEGCAAWHYPQTEEGVYAGHYPADSAEAIRQLETLRLKGGEFLLIPRSAFWWLEHYRELGRHLEDKAKCLWKNEDCRIYQLAIDPAATALAQAPLDHYEAWLEVNRWGMRRLVDLRMRLARMPVRPLISVIMPAYNPPPRLLDKAIESIYHQVYDHWELCVAEDGSTDPEVRRVLKEWQERDSRITVVFRKENGNISRATNSAAELAGGDFLALMDADDELTPDALAEVALYLSEHPEADIVYSDDDKLNEHGTRIAPQFKPDWSPELLLSYMYFSHLFVIRRSLYWRAGGMRIGFEGSQDYDLALRATELTCAVGHIPKVLYHWRVLPGSTALSGAEKPHSFETGLRAVKEALDRRGLGARAVHPAWAREAGCGLFAHVFPDDGPRVAILIPTKDNRKALQVCIDSLAKTSYANYEVVIIDKASEQPEAVEYLRTQPHRVLRIADRQGRCSYAAITNEAARQVDAELLLFLHDDTEVVEAGWLSQMVGYLGIPGVGAVGARLLFPNRTVQQAGVVHGYSRGLAGPAFKNAPSWSWGYLGFARVTRNCTAVTAACLLTRRDTFLSLGGFDEESLAAAYSDVDFCQRVGQKGLRVVYCPSAELVYHEGPAAGCGASPAEEGTYRSRYGGLADRYYNPNLSLEDESFRVQSSTCVPGTPRLIPALMCSHNLNWEGAPKSQYELTVWLKRNGVVEPLVCSPVDGPLRKAYEDNGIRVQVMNHPLSGAGDIVGYEEALLRFSRYITESQVELLYANTLDTFFAIDAARLAGLPSVWNCRESEPWQTHFNSFPPAITARALRCFGYPYKVVFVANATRATYAPLDVHHNFTTIHNGLDRARLQEALNRWPRAEARRRLVISEDKVAILLLGTVCERKGQLDLVEAIGRLDGGLAAQLDCFIVGDRAGAYSDRLHAAHRALEERKRSRVRIVPETGEAALYYSAADLFVCCSRAESFPRVILEAMACGLPIVTTPVFGIVDQVRENVNALYYEPGNAAALADTLRRLLADPGLRHSLGKNSVPVLDNLTDYDGMASAYGRLFREAWFSGGPRPHVRHRRGN